MEPGRREAKKGPRWLRGNVVGWPRPWLKDLFEPQVATGAEFLDLFRVGFRCEVHHRKTSLDTC